MSKLVKIVIFVPTTHADTVRKALGDTGAGVIGNYHHNSFSIKGVGRFIPGDGAQPYIGSIGKPEMVEEQRIETPCEEEILPKVIEAVKNAHPYEEPVIEVYPLIEVPT